MEYFNIQNLLNYNRFSNTNYEGNNQAATTFYRTREQLAYFVNSFVNNKLGTNLLVVYNTKPNRQAGRGRSFKHSDYVLVGVNYSHLLGNEIFLKFEFGDLFGSPKFNINLDVDFKKGESYFLSRRDIIYNSTYEEYSINDDFPNSYDTLFELIKNDLNVLIYKLTIYNSEYMNIKLINLLQYKKQIILQGPPGTGKTKKALELAKALIGNEEGIQENEQLEIIQFHPSYTYEDFVRGIVSVTGEKGISFVAQNKILAQFSKKAQDNYLLSKNDNSDAIIDKWIEDSFEEYKTDMEERVSEKMVLLSNSIGIFDVQNDCFKYGYDWRNPSRINFKDFKVLIKAVIKGTHKIENTISKELSVHAHYRTSYYSGLLKDFFENFKFSNTAEKVTEKKYILIIDEINRANLSSVFGELIYAFEYRGQEVDSMYEVNGSRKLILPPNLLIIGTMNTADRSVSQIDYAIRRRFAFVDVLPEDLSNDTTVSFDSELFKKVSLLFKNEDGTISKHLSEEFKPEEVQLGHSYFIKKDNEGGSMDVRLKYEIKPILKEYVKDGILKQTALAEIEVLSC